MRFLKPSFVALLLLGAAGSYAELTNISTTSLQSENVAAIACTIVGSAGASADGYKALVFLSEGRDPVLTVRGLSAGAATYFNENWGSQVYVDGRADGSDADQIQALLRPAAGPNDAGMLLFVRPGVGICAWSNENIGSGSTLYQAAISITDVTAAWLAR
ncbi:hypothetical protein ABC977_06490 [Thioalkalicoccus limnaeus]|uniref:Uncharacterized protein n=1 Tax=Thioalkalicoccus limnaeus TaxID=120681 RepID=A0ABV4BFD4_9GAMM